MSTEAVCRTESKRKREGEVYAVRDVYYTPAGITAQAMDLYFPPSCIPSTSSSSAAAAAAASSPSAPAPSIAVYIHGGLWTGRDKADYSNIGSALAAQNYITAVVNYRLSPMTLETGDSGRGQIEESKEKILHPTHTQDVGRALQYLLTYLDTHSASSLSSSEALSFQFDPGAYKLFLIGHSCGAHMAGLLTCANNKQFYPSDYGTVHPMLSLPSAAAAASATLPSRSSAVEHSSAACVRVQACIGIQGLYDTVLYAQHFPDWRGEIEYSMTKDIDKWENPTDYPYTHTQSCTYRKAHTDQASASSNDTDDNHADKKCEYVRWLILHSPADKYVNTAQAEAFYAHISETSHTSHTPRQNLAGSADDDNNGVLSCFSSSLSASGARSCRNATLCLDLTGNHFDAVHAIPAAASIEAETGKEDNDDGEKEEEGEKKEGVEGDSLTDAGDEGKDKDKKKAGEQLLNYILQFMAT